MARRKRKTSAARAVAGLPVISATGPRSSPGTRPIRTDGPLSSIIEPWIRSASMLRAGTITKDMHDAARYFQAQFTIARFVD